MGQKKAEKPPRAWWPKKMTEEEYKELADGYGGLCLECGEPKYDGCEPDARDYPCDECGERRVYGAEEARLMGALEVDGEEKG